MNGKKARAIRNACKRHESIGTMPEGYQSETWHFNDARGTNRVGPCLRRLIKIAKKNYKRARGAP